MAKINHGSFVDTVNDMLTVVKEKGMIKHEFNDQKWRGDLMNVDGSEMVNFGTCGYLGLETHPKIINQTVDFTKSYGAQFSVSRTYLTSKINHELEDKLSQIFFGKKVIAFTSTTLVHMSVVPIVVSPDDLIILDQQVHISIQTATQLMVAKGVKVEMVRHNNLEMLENIIQKNLNKYRKIWYMVDGVYSMFGDVAPIDDINALMMRYEKLNLYVDDAHGMSWSGKNGSGRIFEKTIENGRTIYTTTMAKGFGAMGGLVVLPDSESYDKIILHGGPLAYSHPLPPPMIGAALASADIHLSEEINALQFELQSKLHHANKLLADSDIPVLSSPETPIFFIGTGQPSAGWNLSRRILDDGFYINLSMFPAVPVKNTGLRFTITNHNTIEQITDFINAIKYHYPIVLEEEGKTIADVRKAFRLPVKAETKSQKVVDDEGLTLQVFESIAEIDQKEWNDCFYGKGNFDWACLKELEEAFQGNKNPEENWDFAYIIIRDSYDRIVIATFYTSGIIKDDLIEREFVSKKIEKKRKDNRYFLCSRTMMMGCLITEGEHLFLNQEHNLVKKGLKLLLISQEELQHKFKAENVILRDFETGKMKYDSIFRDSGFFKVEMPCSNVITGLPSSIDIFYQKLNGKKRKHLRDDVFAYSNDLKCEVVNQLKEAELELFYELYLNVQRKNLAINMFAFPKKMFRVINQGNIWDFLIIRNGEKILSIGACYKTKDAYFPAIIGLNYDKGEKFKVYKQMLYQVVKRSIELGINKIYFGVSADIEKRKLGSDSISKYAFVNINDHLNAQLMEFE